MKNPEKINLLDFFIDLAQISYVGDVRTYVKAEKSNKMRNTVLGGFSYYQDLYSNNFNKIGLNLQKNLAINSNTENINIELNLSEKTIRQLYRAIPISFFHSVKYREFMIDSKFEENFLFNMTYKERKELIDSYLISSNLKNSVFNIISAIYSTDFNKSFSYILDKYKKSLFK